MENIFSGEDEFNLLVWWTTLYTFAVYWIFGAIYTLMDWTNKPAFLRRYKIQPNTNEPVETKKLAKVVLSVLWTRFLLEFRLPLFRTICWSFVDCRMLGNCRRSTGHFSRSAFASWLRNSVSTIRIAWCTTKESTNTSTSSIIYGKVQSQSPRYMHIPSSTSSQIFCRRFSEFWFADHTLRPPGFGSPRRFYRHSTPIRDIIFLFSHHLRRTIFITWSKTHSSSSCQSSWFVAPFQVQLQLRNAGVVGSSPWHWFTFPVKSDYSSDFANKDSNYSIYRNSPQGARHLMLLSFTPAHQQFPEEKVKPLWARNKNFHRSIKEFKYRNCI